MTALLTALIWRIITVSTFHLESFHLTPILIPNQIKQPLILSLPPAGDTINTTKVPRKQNRLCDLTPCVGSYMLYYIEICWERMIGWVYLPLNGHDGALQLQLDALFRQVGDIIQLRLILALDDVQKSVEYIINPIRPAHLREKWLTILRKIISRHTGDQCAHLIGVLLSVCRPVGRPQIK